MFALTYSVLWFVFKLTAAGAEPTGYIPPLDVRNPPCGLAGAVVGVTYDRPQNPTTVYWPDPYFPGVHCAVDVRAALSTLPAGRYEFAHTVMGEIGTADFNVYPDPHTSADFTIGNMPPPPPPPAAVGLIGTGMQLPAARTLTWDFNAPEADPANNAVAYQAYKDGVAYPETTGNTQPVTLPAYKTYEFAVRAIAADGRMSEPATLVYTLEAPPPPPPPPCSGITVRVDDWSRAVPIGGRGKVAITLIGSFPIVQLQVKLGGQVIGEVLGTDLRDLAGLHFSVPRTAGAYNITVAAKDSTGCIVQTTAVRVVNVS
jgi:hypothetical protein